MLARVARWEGGDAGTIEQTAAQIRSDAESGPPEGVPGKGFLLLTDAEAGKVLAVSLFANEDDYRQGDETLNAMSPPGEGMGQRVGVEKYEVAVQAEA
jgi:predicted RNA-binding protein with EMAP domain